jgi:hypothetical protein
MQQSYEAIALEVILKSVVRRLDHRLSQMQPLAFALLREMEGNVSRCAPS